MSGIVSFTHNAHHHTSERQQPSTASSSADHPFEVENSWKPKDTGYAGLGAHYAGPLALAYRY